MAQVEQLFVAIKGVIVKDGKILLLQESTAYQDGAHAGKWDMPGGRLQPGDHWQEALLREVKEETGLDVTVGRPVGVGEWFPAIRGVPSQVVAIFIECLAQKGDVQISTDHAAAQWFVPDEIFAMDNIIPPTKDIVKAWQAI